LSKFKILQIKLRKMFRYFATIIGCLFTSFALAQTICIQIKDKHTQLPVAAATLACQATMFKTTTDSNGVACLNKKSVKSTTYIKHIGYASLPIPSPTKDTLLWLTPLETTLEQVVVTGMAGNTRLKKTPFAIATVSQKQLWKTTGNNIIELLSKSIPGLSIVTTGPNISKPIIRGLGYNRVLTLLDGMRQEGQQWGDEHGIEIDQYGITKAEVIKGPASLRYGSDAIAGVVNLLPQTSFNNSDSLLHGDALTEYQTNHGLIGLSFGCNQKHKRFFWQFRNSFKMAGNYQNAIDGRVYNTAFREWNMGALIGMQLPKSKHTFHITTFNNIQEIPDGSRDSATRAFTYQVKENDKDTITKRPIVPQDRLFGYHITPIHQLIQHTRVYYKSNIQIGKAELNILAGVQQNRRREYTHPTRPQQAGLDIQLTTYNYDFAYQRSLKNKWQIGTGINGMYQRNQNVQGTDFPIPNYQLLDVGGYAIIKKEWTNLTITGGMRYDYRQINWPSLFVQTDAQGFTQQVAPSVIGSEQVFSQFNQSFSGISGSIGLAWTIQPQLTLKTNLAKGYRSPNINEIGANGLDPGAHIYYLGNTNFKPEYNWQYDIGLYHNTPQYDASIELFSNRINQYIFLQKLFDSNGQPLMLAGNNFTYQYQQGKAHIYGAEISFLWHPTSLPKWSLQQSMSYTMGLNKHQSTLQQYGQAAKYLPLIPPFQTTHSLRYSTLATSRKWQDSYAELSIEQVANQQKIYAVDNTETPTKGYVLVHWQIGTTYLINNKKQSIRLSVGMQNVWNTAYQSHLSRLKYFEYFQTGNNNPSGIYNMGTNCFIKTVFVW